MSDVDTEADTISHCIVYEGKGDKEDQTDSNQSKGRILEDEVVIDDDKVDGIR